LSRDSAGAHRSVITVIAVALVAALALGWGRQRLTSRRWAARSARAIRHPGTWSGPEITAAVVWAVLLAAVVGWDAVSFAYQAHELPTLSYFIGHVTRYPIGRGLLFAVWLAVGGYLVAGWRAGTAP
jgi:hypothetical protein